jgi:hypothetical protein
MCAKVCLDNLKCNVRQALEECQFISNLIVNQIYFFSQFLIRIRYVEHKPFKLTRNYQSVL